MNFQYALRVRDEWKTKLRARGPLSHEYQLPCAHTSQLLANDYQPVLQVEADDHQAWSWTSTVRYMSKTIAPSRSTFFAPGKRRFHGNFVSQLHCLQPSIATSSLVHVMCTVVVCIWYCPDRQQIYASMHALATSSQPGQRVDRRSVVLLLVVHDTMSFSSSGCYQSALAAPWRLNGVPASSVTSTAHGLNR